MLVPSGFGGLLGGGGYMLLCTFSGGLESERGRGVSLRT